MLAPELAASATARRRFLREARAAAAVVHDHVVTIHAVDEANGLPYLVMHYVAGKSLQERLDRDGPLELAEILRIGMQAARAWPRRTRRGWSTATSSRRTSCWRTASSGSRSPTSAWPAPPTTPA